MAGIFPRHIPTFPAVIHIVLRRCESLWIEGVLLRWLKGKGMVLAQQASQTVRERTSVSISELHRIVKESKGIVKVSTNRQNFFWCHVDDWNEILPQHVYGGSGDDD